MSETRIMIVDDDDALRQALQQTLQYAGFDVVAVADAEQALAQLAAQPVHVLVTDVQMPGMDGHALLEAVNLRFANLPVILITAYATVQKAVAAIRHGAADYLVKPFDVQTLVEKISDVLRYSRAPDQATPVAEDPVSIQALQLARQVAATDASVLITGESGVGKEIIARFIHDQSPRREAPFVAINCAAIPENMLEATLFGYEKGSFTGAYQSHAGKFEQANGGTLLLDEISEMDLSLQAKLLRVLQEREVERLGGRKIIALDVRVLATSNRVLHDYVRDGMFREDLFYRLNVFPLRIEPLRKRRNDIVPLAEFLLAKQARAQGGQPYRLSAQAQAALIQYDWPGNVRELDNCLQRAMILTAGDHIDVGQLQFENVAGQPDDPVVDAAVQSGDLKNQENQLILQTLRECMGSRKMAAEKLGISPRTLRYKLARLRDLGMEIPEI